MTAYTNNPSTQKAEGEVLQVDDHGVTRTKEKEFKLHLCFNFCLFYWSFACSVLILVGFVAVIV